MFQAGRSMEKPETTNSMMDLWFVGGSPYAVAGIWAGYPNYDQAMNDKDNRHKTLWSQIMSEYLATKESKSFSDDPSVYAASYCTETGKLALAWGLHQHNDGMVHQ